MGGLVDGHVPTRGRHGFNPVCGSGMGSDEMGLMGDAILRGGLNQLFCVIPCVGASCLHGPAASLASTPSCLVTLVSSDGNFHPPELALVKPKCYLGGGKGALPRLCVCVGCSCRHLYRRRRCIRSVSSAALRGLDTVSQVRPKRVAGSSVASPGDSGHGSTRFEP
ncbi:uncharacterized protein drn isoform X3 [Panulirus ornatus]|uniref:uncharacterized protein drn isoform X3 n=1 Tax=Panulirus ornatus TaxID=150431 RepID=UPI003A85214B